MFEMCVHECIVISKIYRINILPRDCKHSTVQSLLSINVKFIYSSSTDFITYLKNKVSGNVSHQRQQTTAYLSDINFEERTRIVMRKK